MSWLKQERFSLQYDFTLNEIRSKIQRNIWHKGIHYAVIDGRRRFNTEAIEQWLLQQATGQVECDPEAIAFKFATNTKVDSTTKRSKNGPTKPTLPTRLK